MFSFRPTRPIKSSAREIIYCRTGHVTVTDSQWRRLRRTKRHRKWSRFLLSARRTYTDA